MGRGGVQFPSTLSAISDEPLDTDSNCTIVQNLCLLK